MENTDNTKKAPEGTSSANKSGNNNQNRNKHHNRNRGRGRQGKPVQNAEQQAAEAVKPTVPEQAKATEQPKSNSGNRNRNKNRHNNKNRRPEQVKPQADAPAQKTEEQPVQSKPAQSHNRKSERDRRPKPAPSTELVSSIADEALEFLPSRSRSDSDFLSLGKTDDKYLDSMPLDPTLDAVFADVPAVESVEIDGPEIIGVRFEHGSKVYYFDPKDKKYSLGGHVIVETAQGLEYGEVVISNRKVEQDQVVAPLRPVLRAATCEDTAHYEDNRRRQDEAFKICIGKIAEHGLDMKLVECQYTFDNSKLIFFFTSAGRVDFRALVKDLASVFRTRIELRQIGIRDEARMVGGFGVCGRKLCCAGFLPNFVQVSIKMAKEQGLSINASKISGTCGRLMCCLRYEQETYEREIALLPPPDSVVDTPDGRGIVIDIAPISGNIKVRLEGKPDVAPKSYHKSAVKVISKAESKNKTDNGEE